MLNPEKINKIIADRLDEDLKMVDVIRDDQLPKTPWWKRKTGEYLVVPCVTPFEDRGKFFVMHTVQVITDKSFYYPQSPFIHEVEQDTYLDLISEKK